MEDLFPNSRQYDITYEPYQKTGLTSGAINWIAGMDHLYFYPVKDERIGNYHWESLT
jgi:hypothetical protein